MRCRTPHGRAGIWLNVDQLTGNTSVFECLEHFLRKVLGKLHQGVINSDVDSAEVLAAQTTFVSKSADNSTGAHVLALAHCQAVYGHLFTTAIETRGGFAVEAITTAATITTVAAVVTIEAIALARGKFLHEELIAGRGLGGQSGSNVLKGNIVLFRVLLDQLAEHSDLSVLKRIGDGIRELPLAGFVDLIDGRQIHLIQGRIGGALNGTEHATLAGSDKQNSFAGAPSTTSTADAVDIAFGVIRNVIVQHVADPLNVKTTGSNICCDQNVETAVLKLVDRALALCLRDVTVDSCSRESACTELFSEFFSFVLGAHEHDHGLKLSDLKNAGQGVELVAVRDRQVTLGDIGIGTGLGLDRDFLRLTQILAGDPANAVGHCGGKQCNLLVFRGVGENTLDVFLEAHVEHLVCFVQHEEAKIRDVQGTLFEVVDDTTRGADDDLRTAAKAGQLNAVGLATVDRQHVDATKAGGEGLEAVCNLQC